MKPAFALDFRNAAITLLHRTSGGWHEVGSVAIDAPDLTEAVGYLRSTALGLAPRGLSTKLVIPNDQVLYLSVVAPGPDAASRRIQIAAALEGRTPYAIDDLVFDWWGNGPEVQVAVIARETLAEAEGFAVEHRMNPISFVAVPEGRKFRGEPWFGPTSLASTLVPEGEKIDRDQDPVQIIARSLATEPTPKKQPASKPAKTKVDPEAPPEVIPEPEVQETSDPELVSQSVPEPETFSEPEQISEIEPPPAAKPELTKNDLVVDPAPAESSQPETVLLDDLPTAAFVDALAPALGQEPAIASPPPTPTLDEAPMALDVLPDDPPPADKPFVTAPVIEDDLPPPLSLAALSAFSSRRHLDPAVIAPPRLGGIQRPSALGPTPPPKTTVQAPLQPTVERPFQAKPPPTPTTVTVTPAIPPAPNAEKPLANGKAAKPLRGLGAVVAEQGVAGSKDRKAADPASAAASLAPAKKPVPVKAPSLASGAKQRGKPRYLGLILTGVLLLTLALIAAWSSYKFAFRDESPQTTETASLSQDASAIDASNDIPAPEDEMAADMQDPDQLAADAAAQNESTTDPLAADQPLTDPVATAPQPATDGAVDPVATDSALPAADSQGEIILATMDPPPLAPDPLSLPQPDAQGDVLPAAQPAPPPFGTTYEFDANGLIRPTPDGVVTPEGVRLVAGPPPVLPPERPAGLALPNVAPATQADSAPATEPPAFPSDPALSGFRPKLRPVGLKAEADTTFAPESGTRVASLRPRARPAAVLAASEAARQATAEASLVAEPAVLTDTVPASQLAVAISRRPQARPRDLSRSVEAAVAAAVRTPEPKAQQPAQDNAAPEADNEPEVASAMPKIPTRASVAKQATFANAINLSKINLIGVYGTQSNRSALVRQANGRYKKVKVGDSLDGGRVAAITATEIRYQKGSKMLVLALPKS